jgi:hypothetical protein
LRAFENGVLRRIFGPKWEDVTGGWRKLHKEELHYSYFSQDISRMIESQSMRWSGHVARMGWKIRGNSVLRETLKERYHLEYVPRRRWEYSIEMDLNEIGWEIVDWIHLAHDRDEWRAPVNGVKNLRVP